MKTQFSFFIYLIVVIILAILPGCTTTEQTIYLQDVTVSGPVNAPPLHITENDSSGTITLSPRLTFFSNNKKINGKVEGHSLVNDQGALQLDTIYRDGVPTYRISDANKFPYEKDNFFWNMPDFSAGLDIEMYISKRIVFSMGFGLTNLNNTSLVNGNLGLGIITSKEDFSFRIDLGLLMHQFQYTASTVVVTSVNSPFTQEYTFVTLYKDRGKELNFNPYVQLTYNTHSKNLPVDFFLSFGFFGQTLTDFEPDEFDPQFTFFGSHTVEDTRGETSTSFLNFTPGLFLKLTDNHRIALGTKCLYKLGFEELSRKFFVLPFVQFDLTL